jgi:hypothetical protein
LNGKPSESGIIGRLVTQLDHSRPGIEKRPAKCDAVGKAVDPTRVAKENVFGMAHGNGHKP